MRVVNRVGIKWDIVTHRVEGSRSWNLERDEALCCDKPSLTLYLPMILTFNFISMARGEPAFHLDSPHQTQKFSVPNVGTRSPGSEAGRISHEHKSSKEREGGMLTIEQVRKELECYSTPYLDLPLVKLIVHLHVLGSPDLRKEAFDLIRKKLVDPFADDPYHAGSALELSDYLGRDTSYLLSCLRGIRLMETGKEKNSDSADYMILALQSMQQHGTSTAPPLVDRGSVKPARLGKGNSQILSPEPNSSAPTRIRPQAQKGGPLDSMGAPSDKAAVEAYKKPFPKASRSPS